jgi:hypothetical protein
VIPSIPPPPLALPQSMPMPSNPSHPGAPAPWHVTPSPQPAAPPVPGSSLVPPPNPFASGGYEVAQNVPAVPTSSARNMAMAETVVVRKKSKAGLVLGLVATLCVTGVVAFLVGTKVLSPKEGGGDGAHSADPQDTTTTTTAVTTTPSAQVSVATPMPAPAPAPEPVVTASAKVTLAKPPPSTKTTGIVKVKRNGWGHRIYIDGQVAGQGGRDITWQCGSHRVKVGSAGKESTVEIPCGGTVEVD